MRRILTILAFIITLYGAGQTPVPEHIVFEYDKPNGCYMGDTVHFSVSLDSAAKSRVVYVELLHPNGQAIVSRKLHLDSHLQVSGALPVDTLYGSGFYYIRAFTRYAANFTPMQYPLFVLPVYRHEESIGRKYDENSRYISTVVYNSGGGAASRREPEKKTGDAANIVFTSRQPVEDQLIVFGKLDHKVNVTLNDENPYYGRRFHVAVAKGRLGYNGEAVTDSNGYFEIKFPDTIRGDWNIVMYEKKSGRRGEFKTEQLARYRIIYGENFAPKLPASTDSSPELFGFRKWREDPRQKNVVTQFFNCDEATIRNLNNGKVARGLYSWLGSVNDRFENTRGVASPNVMNTATDTTYNAYLDLNFPNGNDSDDPRTVCVNGPLYNGRPIVWIVNGEYRMITGLDKRITDFRVLRPSRRHIPQYLDEVRTIFTTDAPDAFYPYVRCSVLEKRKPLTIFITTHEGYIWNDSALMTGHFRGYDN